MKWNKQTDMPPEADAMEIEQTADRIDQQEEPMPEEQSDAASGTAADPQKPQESDRITEEAKRIDREMTELIRSGRMPNGFDMGAALADPAFLQLLLEMPVYAAVRVYMAEQEAKEAPMKAMQALMERLKTRATLPQPTRSDTTAMPTTDYMAMSPETFALLEQRLKKAAQKGRRVRL